MIRLAVLMDPAVSKVWVRKQLSESGYGPL